jgi:prepilin peptidase CpaA
LYLSLSYLSINDFVLITLIGVSLFFDLTRNKIPNYLTFPAIAFGIMSYTLMQSLSGLWFSLLGLLVGLAIFFIPFAMGGMGGGDVKLLGAVGALQGWQFVLSAAILTAFAGGVMAIIYLIATGRLLRMLKKIMGFFLIPFFSSLYLRFHLDFLNRVANIFYDKNPEKERPSQIPYGAAIAAGVLIQLAIDFFQWGEAFYGSFLW